MISAKVLADSKYRENRVISLEVTLPKYLDAEVEKHGLIASNSSSDRAKSFGRMAESMPYLMSDIRAEEKGMQGYTKVDDDVKSSFRDEMRSLHDYCVDRLSVYKDTVHHQHLNRYLIPWAMQTKIMTANDFAWAAFISLRNAKDADPAMIELAGKIKLALISSRATILTEGQWHLPYVGHGVLLDQIKVSAARCCRVSYDNHGTGSDSKKDFELHDKLIKNKHLTPFEHQLVPITDEDQDGVTHLDRWGNLWSGRAMGFVQYRKLVHSEWI